MRKIIHLDLDAFFCAVEEQRDPSLAGKAFAVGGRPESRGVVASCSYPARRFGVHSALPMAQAVRRCPGLIIVPGRHHEYSAASRRVMARLRALTPQVEQLSIDEAFIDVSTLPQSAVLVAQELQRSIREELGLPNSLGVATNKLVAKIANNVGKAAAAGDGPPNAIKVVAPGEEAQFLAPLPCDALWGVGPKTAQRLRALGMETIGEIAAWDAADLARRFGKHGRDLWRRAQGIDVREVETEREAKSISQEITYASDVSERSALEATLRTLSQQVGARLRKQKLTATTVKLKLRWHNFETPTRQVTLSRAIDSDDEIYAAVLPLFRKLWGAGRPVRLLGVGVSGLGDMPRQLGLWDMDRPEFLAAEAAHRKEQRLAKLVASLEERFGEGAIRRGGDVTRDL